ncbi:MAG: hypothetical protein HQL48_08115 [Gammaproteobacteria bacterium]|nr:hypothetical protein [Gammaproteobacteria bacterium]
MFAINQYKIQKAGFQSIGLLISLLISTDSLANSDINREVEELIQRREFVAAYNLTRLHLNRQGSGEFDFLFGLAALNSGHPAEGVMALERYLTLFPANDRARLELAKGYYALADYQRARQEFEFVLSYQPPDQVKTTIQAYLDNMSTESAVTDSTSTESYVSVSLGYDSNVNSGTYTDRLNLVTGPVLLDASETGENVSPYLRFEAGSQWINYVDTALATYAGIDGDIKHNSHNSEFDTTGLGGYVGLMLNEGKGRYKLSISNKVFLVDSHKYRNTFSYTGESYYALDHTTHLNSVLQYSEVSYVEANRNNDAKVFTLAGGVNRLFAIMWKPAISLQVTAAQESNLHLRRDLDRELITSRLSLNITPVIMVNLHLGVTYQQSQYGGEDFAFGTVREDSLISTDINLGYRFSDLVLFKIDLQVSENESNQALYNYRRSNISFGLRYQF